MGQFEYTSQLTVDCKSVHDYCGSHQAWLQIYFL